MQHTQNIQSAQNIKQYKILIRKQQFYVISHIIRSIKFITFLVIKKPELEITLGMRNNNQGQWCKNNNFGIAR